jgi:hypothetical protein
MAEYDAFLALWYRDAGQRDAQYDTQRFARLLEIIDGRLDLLLSRYSRRVVFNISRTIRPDEVRVLLARPDDRPEFFPSITHVVTQAIVCFGQRRESTRLEGATVVYVSAAEYADLAERLPGDLARVYALAALRLNAEIGLRGAGKGLRLAELPARRRPHTPEWEFALDPALQRAMADYDERRIRSGATVTGMPAEEDLTTSSLIWPTLGVGTVPVTVEYPAARLAYTSHTYLLTGKDVAMRLAQLADTAAEFEKTFGLALDDFVKVCWAMSWSIWRATGAFELDPVGVHDDRLVFRSKLPAKDPRLASAPTQLRSLLAEGVLRAPRETWLETLSRDYEDGSHGAPVSAVNAFIAAFTTGTERDVRALRPVLFHDLEPNSLVLDLTMADQFFDFCFSAVHAGSGGGAAGRIRGKHFEAHARTVLMRRLGLTERDLPIPANYKLRKAGLPDSDVDFCFLVGSVLIHLDMKSWCRPVGYHRGDFWAVQKRLKELSGVLDGQLDPRGRVLLDFLRGRGAVVDTVVNLLCVADVEYLPPDPKYFYGDIPRVLTPDEIVELVTDPVRWDRLISSAEAEAEAPDVSRSPRG